VILLSREQTDFRGVDVLMNERETNFVAPIEHLQKMFGIYQGDEVYVVILPKHFILEKDYYKLSGNDDKAFDKDEIKEVIHDISGVFPYFMAVLSKKDKPMMLIPVFKDKSQFGVVAPYTFDEKDVLEGKINNFPDDGAYINTFDELVNKINKIIDPRKATPKPEPEPKQPSKPYLEPIEYPPITVDFSGAIWNPPLILLSEIPEEEREKYVGKTGFATGFKEEEDVSGIRNGYFPNDTEIKIIRIGDLRNIRAFGLDRFGNVAEWVIGLDRVFVKPLSESEPEPPKMPPKIVGRKYEVLVNDTISRGGLNHSIEVGDIVTLTRDDGSEAPEFRVKRSGKNCFVNMHKLKLLPESESEPESTGPPKPYTKYLEPIEYPPITVDLSGVIWNPPEKRLISDPNKIENLDNIESIIINGNKYKISKSGEILFREDKHNQDDVEKDLNAIGLSRQIIATFVGQKGRRIIYGVWPAIENKNIKMLHVIKYLMMAGALAEVTEPEPGKILPEPEPEPEPDKPSKPYIEPIEYPPITVDFSGAIWNPPYNGQRIAGEITPVPDYIDINKTDYEFDDFWVSPLVSKRGMFSSSTTRGGDILKYGDEAIDDESEYSAYVQSDKSTDEMALRPIVIMYNGQYTLWFEMGLIDANLIEIRTQLTNDTGNQQFAESDFEFAIMDDGVAIIFLKGEPLDFVPRTQKYVLLSDLSDIEKDRYIGKAGITTGFEEGRSETFKNGYFPNDTKVMIMTIHKTYVGVHGTVYNGLLDTKYIGFDKVYVEVEGTSIKTPESPEPDSEPKPPREWKEPIEYPPITVDLSGVIWNPNDGK
jgi:hypothetical protein